MFDPAQVWDWIILSLEWTTIVVLVAALVLAGRSGYILRLRAPLTWLLSNERRPLCAAFLIACVTAVLTSTLRPAQPVAHDEYSYLLASDTFAHGRLTNPAHPFWPHFETFHVLQQPSYQSRYPPAQGLFLAAGQLLSGAPIVGVWLSLALACAALYWCLRAWASRGWALFGAMLPSIRFGSGFFWHEDLWAYWGASYWGGAVAFLGASLALGAAPRLLRNPRRRYSLLLGLGFGMLAASRPFEGLIAAALISAFLLFELIRRNGSIAALRGLAPAAFVVAACCCALSYYNWRVTGSPFSSPYTVYAAAYDIVPIFTFQDLAPEPEYRHDVLRRFHLEFMVSDFQSQKEGPGIDMKDLRLLADFFLGPTLTVVTLLGLFWRSRWLALVLLMLVAALLSHAVTLSPVFRPHYFAPFVPVLLLLTVRGLRVLHAGRCGGFAIGGAIAKAIVVSCLVTFAGSTLARVQTKTPIREQWNRLASERSGVAERLSKEGPKHIVLVRYDPQHNVHREWVYNLSEIDKAPVIWAREMKAADNRALRDYYRDRKVWLLEADERPPRLSRYD